MLSSALFSGNADLESVANGERTVEADEESDTVGLIQQALLAIGIDLPERGADNVFSQETSNAILFFKSDRLLASSESVVDSESIVRLDLEISFLEGNSSDPESLDATALRIDPFMAGVHENQLGAPGIGDKLLRSLDLGDRFCFRASIMFDTFITSSLGRFIEPFIFVDFCSVRQPCPALDIFFDRDASSAPYVQWLQSRNPIVDPGRIAELGQIRRPDMLIDRDPTEWWEIKPQSISGAIDAWVKFRTIIPAYAERGLPYLPGKSYHPNEIILGHFGTPEGENLTLILEVRSRAPGLLFYTLCVQGDWVSYFNRVRLAAGIAALLAALVEVVVPAIELAGVLASLSEILVGLQIGILPILIRQ